MLVMILNKLIKKVIKTNSVKQILSSSMVSNMMKKVTVTCSNKPKGNTLQVPMNLQEIMNQDKDIGHESKEVQLEQLINKSNSTIGNYFDNPKAIVKDEAKMNKQVQNDFTDDFDDKFTDKSLSSMHSFVSKISSIHSINDEKDNTQTKSVKRVLKNKKLLNKLSKSIAKISKVSGKIAKNLNKSNKTQNIGKSVFKTARKIDKSSFRNSSLVQYEGWNPEFYEDILNKNFVSLSPKRISFEKIGLEQPFNIMFNKDLKLPGKSRNEDTKLPIIPLYTNETKQTGVFDSKQSNKWGRRLKSNFKANQYMKIKKLDNPFVNKKHMHKSESELKPQSIAKNDMKRKS